MEEAERVERELFVSSGEGYSYQAQAIPMYTMQCFKLPMKIIDEIEKMFRNFFWGQKGDEKKMAWVDWKTLCRSKKEGGMAGVIYGRLTERFSPSKVIG